eukprot:GHVR01024430.1.p1 GENE.GHVR01024430.1~~GHVR01024430.1.p1  ORF type:complete len:279 (+),score=114.24 GHVR01024430.1:129-965(+)
MNEESFKSSWYNEYNNLKIFKKIFQKTRILELSNNNINAVWEKHKRLLETWGKNIEDFVRVLLFLVPMGEDTTRNEIFIQTVYSCYDVFVLYRKTILSYTNANYYKHRVLYELLSFILKTIRCCQVLLEIKWTHTLGRQKALVKCLKLEIFKLFIKIILHSVSIFPVSVDESAIEEITAASRGVYIGRRTHMQMTPLTTLTCDFQKKIENTIKIHTEKTHTHTHTKEESKDNDVCVRVCCDYNYKNIKNIIFKLFRGLVSSNDTHTHTHTHTHTQSRV